MTRIEEIRNQISGINKQIKAAIDKGYTLASDPNASTGDITAAKNELDGLKQRRELLTATLNDETDPDKVNPAAFKAMDNVRAAGAKFKSFGDFLDTVRQADTKVNPHIDTRLGEYMTVKDAAGQNITTNADGGYLVPPDYADGLMKMAQQESVLLDKVQRIPISGNRLIRNVLKQSSMKDSVTTPGSEVYGRNGGLIAYWKAEAAEFAASKLNYEQEETPLHKLTGLAYATEEMLEDLPAMSAYISQGFQEEFAFKIDDAIINGSGNGQPKGILAYHASTVAQNNAALITVAKESGQAAATINTENILKMYNRMPARNRANAIWFINQDLEMELLKLFIQTGVISSGGASAVEEVSGTFNKLVYLPAGGLTGQPNGTLLGRPVMPIEQCAALGSKGDIILFDPSQYIWMDKGGVSSEMSIHVRFVYEEMAFRFSYRCGGTPAWLNTIEEYKGTTTRSPYVCLAARA